MAAGPPSEDFSFPPCFLQPAKTLVILTGLDTRNNAVHSAIWHLFTSGRAGEAVKPVTYKSVTADHIYPRDSPVQHLQQTQSTEDVTGSIPPSPTPPPTGGILSCDWIEKLSLEIPAVVVFFFDLDWNHPQWSEKVTECASKVQVIRSSLDSLSTEFCVALIQSVRPLPTGTDPGISEQASELCQALGLPNTNLFVMPYVDRPEGFITRLEMSFYDMALRYYGNYVKKMRVSKEVTGTSQSHHLSSIGKQFKVAYLTEMKQDHKEALRLYSACYKYLTECMTLSEDRIMEFKMVAGFLNYKMCYLMFEYDDPRQSLNQFQTHLDHFRSEKGPEPLVFQHKGWMANQFMSFGDLFAEAVRKQLRPTQTVHPGIYYYEAIQCLFERRRLQKFYKECYDSLPHPLPSLATIEYTGQRPWRVGLSDSQPSVSELREKSIVILQAREYSRDFSYWICLLLNKALDHFKQLQHQTNNMISHLTVLLAEEYYLSKDYEKSLALLERIVYVYRDHKWWAVLSSLLQKMLQCSYMLGDVKCYVSTVMELISRFIPVDKERKLSAQNNLNLILKGHPPQPEVSSVESDNTEYIHEMWYSNLSGLSAAAEDGNQEIFLMSSLAGCVECKAVFSDNSFSSDSVIKLSIYFRSSAPIDLTLSKVQVLMDNQVYSKWCAADDDVKLEPEKIKSLEYQFPALTETIQISSVEAVLSGGIFKLVWTRGVSKDDPSLSDWHWNRIKNRRTTLVLQREAKSSLNFEKCPVILLGEYYPVQVRVKNNEDAVMKDIKISALFLLDQLKSKIKEDGTPLVQLYVSPPFSSSASSSSTSSTQQDSLYSIHMMCDTLQPSEELVRTFYVKSVSIGSQSINVSLSYSVDCIVREDWEAINCPCLKEEMLTIETVTPLRVSHKIMNMKFQPADVVFYDEPFLLQSSLHSLSPWQLLLGDTRYQLNKSVTSLNQTNLPKVKDTILSQQDVATEIRCIKVCQSDSSLPPVSPPSDIQLTLGSYHYQWSRKGGGEEEGEGSSVMMLSGKNHLPQVNVKYLPYSVTAELPSHATQHELVLVNFKVNNKTIYVHEFETHLSVNSDFISSGNKLSRFRVLPLSSYSLTFNLFPLVSGYVSLPKLEVTCLSQPKLDEQVLQATTASLPTSIYVMPLSSEGVSPHSSLGSSIRTSVTASM